MSGIEVAGLVLGAIPLLIAALEHHESGLDRIKAFWNWGDELSKFRRTLGLLLVSYDLTLRVLLAPMITDARLEEMLANPSGDLWKSEDVCRQLQCRLDVAYTPYLDIISEIERIIIEISSKLNINRANKVGNLFKYVGLNLMLTTVLQVNQLEAIIVANQPTIFPRKADQRYQFKNQLKFTMKRQKIKRLLVQLEDCTARLDGLLAKAEKLEPYNRGQKSTLHGLAARLQQVQRYASNLHGVLSQALGCTSHASHCVNLLLEQRIKTLKKKSTSSKACRHGPEIAACFTLLLTHPSTPSEWQRTEIQVLEDVDPQVKYV